MNGAARLLGNIVRMMVLLVMYPFAKLFRRGPIPILAYHFVHDNLMCPYSLSVARFRRQLGHLRSKGYESITVHDLVSYVQGKSKRLPPKAVVLSFDDGYADFCSQALPILRQHGFRAVLSVVGDFCEKGTTDWVNNGSPVRALSWEEVKGVSSEGIEIASHSMSHAELTSIPLEQANWEIGKSKKEIEAVLNGQVDLFCYPHGACNDKIVDLVKRNGYKAAMTTAPGLVRRGDDIYRLKRIPINGQLSLMGFRAALTPAVEWYCAILWGKIGRVFGFSERQIF